jgi:hypothetical protein
LSRLGAAIVGGINAAVAWLAGMAWRASSRTVDFLARFPVFGGVVQRYTAHYDEANRTPAQKFSERTRGFFQRWSVKFTAEYYKDKERQDAAKGVAGA